MDRPGRLDLAYPYVRVRVIRYVVDTRSRAAAASETKGSSSRRLERIVAKVVGNDVRSTAYAWPCHTRIVICKTPLSRFVLCFFPPSFFLPVTPGPSTYISSYQPLTRLFCIADTLRSATPARPTLLLFIRLIV